MSVMATTPPHIEHLADNLISSLAGVSNLAPSTYGDSLAEQVNGYLDRTPEQGETVARDLVDRLREAARTVHDSRRV